MSTKSDHPKFTPPTELVQQWIEETRSYDCVGAYPADLEQCVATRAAQWGADQELEACCEWVGERLTAFAASLKTARRPKPPSLKEQALEALERQCLRSISPLVSTSDLDTIRRALEALDG
jgi:hypothetical protein